MLRRLSFSESNEAQGFINEVDKSQSSNSPVSSHLRVLVYNVIIGRNEEFTANRRP
jgi:predicted DNA-binding ribbon-helix-helix protein